MVQTSSPAVDTVTLPTVQVMEPAPAPTLQRFDRTMLMPAVPIDQNPVPAAALSQPTAFAPPAPDVASPILERVESNQRGVASPAAAPRTIPWERITAAGASVISFASMMVAMGPILKSVGPTQLETTAAADGATVEVPAAGVVTATPAAPAVDIQVAPGAEGAIAPAADAQLLNAQAQLASPSVDQQPGVGAVAAGTEAVDNATAAQQTPAPAPSTEAPQPSTDGSGEAGQVATTPPTTAAAPAAAAPTTAAPTTAAPTTPPPTTAAPTTAPPTTAPAETPPPRSEGSG